MHHPILVCALFFGVLICHFVALLLFQEMDPPHPFPKEIPHNEKLLSLKYEVGLFAGCPCPTQSWALYPFSTLPPPAARRESRTWLVIVLSVPPWSAELGL